MARVNKRPVAITASLLRRWQLPKPGEGGDKNDRGVALVIGGATEIPGAPLLAATAALRVGVGKIQLGAPRSAAISLGVALPEARVYQLPESGDGFLDRKSGSRAGDCSKESEATLIGPGMMNDDAIRGFMDEALHRITDQPLVIDALALGALRGGRYRFTDETRVVITPNIDEMARITGETPETINRDPRGIAVSVAQDLNVVVFSKDPRLSSRRRTAKSSATTKEMSDSRPQARAMCWQVRWWDSSPAEQRSIRPPPGPSICTGRPAIASADGSDPLDFWRGSCAMRSRPS